MAALGDRNVEADIRSRIATRQLSIQYYRSIQPFDIALTISRHQVNCQ